MANGAFNFKDNSGNVVSFISGSGSDIIMSGGTLDLSGMTGLTLGNLTMEGTVETASFAPSYLLTSSFNSYTGTTDNIIGTLQTSTSSLNSFTSSANSRLDTIEGVTGSYATTGSNTFNGNLTVTGYIDAQELRTTFISSSILYRSGSTKFGDESTDTHDFTGSLLVDGQVSVSPNTNSSYVSSTIDAIKMGRTTSGRPSLFLDTSDTTYTNRVWFLENYGPSGSLIIGRNGLDAVKINNSGDFGIGSVPLYKLDVNSGTTNVVARFESTDGTASIMLKDNSGNVELSATGNSFSVQPGGGTATFTVNSDSTSVIGKFNINTGTAGIGVDIPNQASGTIFFANGSGGTAVPNIVAKSGNNLGLNIVSVVPDVPAAGLDMAFDVRETDNTDFATLTSTAYRFGRFGNSLMEIKRNGKIGVGTLTPESGIQINKFGSKFDSDVQYNQPTGNIFLSISNVVANEDNWFGIRGSYNSSSGTSNILLQANYRDVGSQAGHYISSKATALGIADFEIGKLTTSTSVSTPPTKVPHLTITSAGAATFSSSVSVSSTLSVEGGILGNSYIRAAGGSDLGSQLVLWANGSGNTFLAGYDFSINTGLNNARTTKFYISNTGAATFSGKGTFSNSAAGSATISTNNTNSDNDSEMSNLNFDGNRIRLGVLGSDSSYGCIGSNGGSTGLAFVTHNGTSWAERLRITIGGAMGLGLTPTNTAGRFEASNDIVAFSSSDIRWKNNIKEISNSLEKLSNLRGVSFDWLEDEPIHGNKGHDYGVIAQEVESLFPEMVQTRDNGMKAVKYDRLIPVLIEAIKELNNKIKVLEEK